MSLALQAAYGRLILASEFAVSAASAVQPVVVPRATPLATAQVANPPSPQEADLTSPSPPPVNPGLHFDLALNIVVLQFFDSRGDVTQSIPSQKQLDAYQNGTSTAAHSGANSALI